MVKAILGVAFVSCFALPAYSYLAELGNMLATLPGIAN